MDSAELACWRPNLSEQVLKISIPAEFSPPRAHVAAMAEWAEGAGLAEAGALWHNLGAHMRMVAKYQGAKAHFERALMIWEKFLPADQENLQIVRENLAAVARKLEER